MSKVNHIIGRTVLDVTHNGNADGIALQQKTEGMLRSVILPGMEIILDRYGPSDSTVVIDRIDIDINIDGTDFQSKFGEQILTRIEDSLKSRIEDEAGEKAIVKPASERTLELLLVYLAGGYMPWWSGITSQSQLEERVMSLFSNEIADKGIQQVLHIVGSLRVRTRLATQFSDECFWQIVSVLASNTTDLVRVFRHDMEVIIQDVDTAAESANMAIQYKTILLEAIGEMPTGTASSRAELMAHKFAMLFVRHLSAGTEMTTKNTLAPQFTNRIFTKIENTSLKNVLSETIAALSIDNGQHIAKAIPSQSSTDNIQPDKMQQEPATNKEGITGEQPVFINNAGLVIIAPYFKTFFERLGLLEDSKINDVTRAVTLVQYIATGSNDFAEFEVVLPKVLCGIDISQPLEGRHILTNDEKTMITGLLEAVIANWSALKNTSVDGFRGSFLVREGKLTFTNNQWHLRVHRMAYDVLLDYLPWSISMIKMSWMAHLLNVDWKL